jgi:hypothetical protein
MDKSKVVLKDIHGHPVAGLKFALVNEDSSDAYGQLEVHAMECGDLRRVFPGWGLPAVRAIEWEANTILELSGYAIGDLEGGATPLEVVEGRYDIKPCAAKSWKFERAVLALEVSK